MKYFFKHNIVRLTGFEFELKSQAVCSIHEFGQMSSILDLLGENLK